MAAKPQVIKVNVELDRSPLYQAMLSHADLLDDIGQGYSDMARELRAKVARLQDDEADQ